MNAPSAPVHGRIDGEDRLVAADPPLAHLHARAGGAEGGVVAVPQLAALGRLVRRLGIVVSRGIVAADGEQDLDLWVRAAPDGDGVALAIVGWSARAAASPVETDAQAHDFLRAGADWVWETDDALRLTVFAPPLADAPAVGEPLSRVLTLLPQADGALPLLEALALRERFEGQAATLRGATRVRLAGAPLLDASGRLLGLRGVAVRAEAEPPAVPAAPDAFGRRLDDALRGPLDRIIASAETIHAQEDGPLRRDYAQYAADIATAGRHLLALVDDLVDLQAIERPAFAVPVEPVDLADVARRAAGLLGVRASGRGVRIDAPQSGETLPALGDFRRCLQILVNLVGNAVRYSPEGAAVWVRVESEGELAAVIVADQGKGIAAADQARIFDKFERVDPHEPGGTGLGLYIARRLARAMGGDIAVDSAPGQGARFVLTLKGA